MGDGLARCQADKSPALDLSPLSPLPVLNGAKTGELGGFWRQNAEKKNRCKSLTHSGLSKSGRLDLNQRPLGPEKSDQVRQKGPDFPGISAILPLESPFAGHFLVLRELPRKSGSLEQSGNGAPVVYRIACDHGESGSKFMSKQRIGSANMLTPTEQGVGPSVAPHTPARAGGGVGAPSTMI
jgi:hypothetical protein